MGTLSVIEDRPGSASAGAALDRPAPPLSPWRPMRGSLMEGRTLELRDLGAGEAEAGGAKTIADDEMRTAYAAGFCTWQAGRGRRSPPLRHGIRWRNASFQRAFPPHGPPPDAGPALPLLASVPEARELEGLRGRVGRFHGGDGEEVRAGLAP